MATENSVVKRKRSRPSDWWAVVPTSKTPEAQQHGEPPPQKRVRTSIASGPSRSIQEAPATGNGGKTRKLLTRKPSENVDGDKKVSKPSRTGRPSNTQAELEAVAIAEQFSETEGADRWKRGPAQKQKVVRKLAKGRPSNTKSQAIVLVSTQENKSSRKNCNKRVGPATYEGESASQPVDRSVQTNRKRGEAPAAQEKDKGSRAPVEAAVVQGKSQTEPTNSVGSSVPAATKKKRGRTLSNRQSPDSPRSHKAGEASKPLRRGRSSNTEGELFAVTKLAPKPLLEGNRGRRLSGQSATGTRYFDIAETLAAVSTNQVGTIRKRREGQSNAEMDEPAAAERSATASHRSAGRNQLPATSVEVDSATSSFGRNGKASKKVNDTSKASNLKIEKASSAAHKPSKSSRGQQQLRIEIRQVAESNSREQKSRQAAKADTKSNRTRVNKRAEESPPSKRRRLVTEFPAEEASQMEDAPKYQRLAPVIRKISLQTIETKWEPLPPACVERISQLVHEVQKPVLVYLNQEKKRMEANSVLQMFSRRLISKITKGIPFPPAMRKSREEDFEFEKILDHNSTLEAQLNSALHANELLEFELAKETAYLEWEQASLMGLQANAKSEMAMRKGAERKLHLLLQSHPTIIDDAEKNLFGIGKTSQRGFPLFHTEDKDLHMIAQELNGHLDTIQGNIGKIGCIPQAMTKARAAVQASLYVRLGRSEYEDIILG